MIFKNTYLLLLFCSLFMVMLGFGIVIPALPFFARELGASSFDMGMLVTVWAGAQFIITPKWGAYSDRVGRRPAILLGLLGLGFAFFLLGSATSLWMLYVARILGGLLSASTMPAAKAYVADVSSPEERGASMGLIGAAFGLGFMLGPMVGGLLAPFGVRLTFYLAGTLGLLTAIPVYFLLPEPQNRETATTSGSLVRVMVDAARKPHAILYWVPFAMTFAGIALFSMLGFYLMDKFGSSEAQVGVAFTINGATAVITQGFLIGPVMFRLGELKTLRAGLVFAGVGYALLPLAPSFELTLVCIAFASVGMSLGRPVVTSILSKTTDIGQGMTMGVQTAYDSMGRMLGPMWAGFIYAGWIHGPYVSAALVYGVCLLFLARSWGLLERSEHQFRSIRRPSKRDRGVDSMRMG